MSQIQTKVKSKLKSNVQLNNANSIIITEYVKYKLKALSIDGNDTYSDIIERLIDAVDINKLEEINKELSQQLFNEGQEGFKGEVII